ncbi:conserved hypothetical protein [Uncinocarpus reesii 1704]|uniref:Uncharacterized protein n=1 Tax=Uncinocarpus reesii (strain UAMH 1704) TaxID=336963 RepID=C4JKM7_UNCRE|nr:uncharacterized protein UREG_00324 [Uncinocarpus reesii 1704]EEP75478.1 conserved hypothetical protein [Uncinocarpus reesii 1704]
MAPDTMQRYMERRSHERKVRSLAQWSRQSEALLSRTRVPRRGRERKRGWSAARRWLQLERLAVSKMKGFLEGVKWGEWWWKVPGEVHWLNVEGIRQRVIGVAEDIVFDIGARFSRHDGAFHSLSVHSGGEQV